jgi:hypothetical protein
MAVPRLYGSFVSQQKVLEIAVYRAVHTHQQLSPGNGMQCAATLLKAESPHPFPVIGMHPKYRPAGTEWHMLNLNPAVRINPFHRAGDQDTNTVAELFH